MKNGTHGKLFVAGAALLLAALTPTIAAAHTDVVFGINLGGLFAPPAVVYSPPAYYAPAPAYYAPAPVYYAPRVIYRNPGFVYYRHSSRSWHHRAWRPAPRWHHRGHWHGHGWRHAHHHDD